MALTIPVLAIDKIMDYATEMDSLTGKIRQNLELGERYHNNNKLLEQDLQHLRDAAGLFAMGYGAKLNEVAEAQQIISRRFKDTDTINFVTNMAMQISRLDNVPLKLAAENIESVILQFKLGTEEAQAFSNQMAVAAHTGRITGQELLQGLQRSGSAFKALNMGTAESISLLTTLTTVTARSGAEVGEQLPLCIGIYIETRIYNG